MKKIYEELKVNVISLDASDVIATSGAPVSQNLADRGLGDYAGAGFDLGDFSHQDF